MWKTILQTTLGRKRWAVRAEDYQQSPFPHFIPLKFLQSTQRLEKYVCKEKGKCLENYQKFREL